MMKMDDDDDVSPALAVWYDAVDGDKHRSLTLAYDDESDTMRFLSINGKTADWYDDSASDDTLFDEFARGTFVFTVIFLSTLTTGKIDLSTISSSDAAKNRDNESK